MKYTVQGFKGRKYRNLVAFTQAYIDLLKIGKNHGNLYILADDNPENMGKAVDSGCGDYFVFLNPKFTVSDLCQTLAHEMVHIKQYVKGQLKLKAKGVIWCGKMYRWEDSPSYVNRPWEIEAMKKETILHYTAQEMVS